MDLQQRLVMWDDIMRDVEEAQDYMEFEKQILPQRNPLSLSNEKFIKKFRLTKHVFENLVEMLTPYIRAPTRNSALTVQTKVLAALRFFASGSYQEITGTNHYVGISQPSVSRCVKEVCNGLNEPEIFNNVISFQRTLQEMQNLRTSFFEKHQFPGIIGCIDCTHVGIVAPSVNDPVYPEHVYVNRKNYHSINVQLICDSNLKIMNVNAQFPGSTHDANIWGNSAVSRVMEDIYRRDPGNVFFLIGDSGYPTRPWLLTPIHNPTTEPEVRFNNRFCNIRATIERCNGVLKNRFRCLLKHRILHYSPTTASKIINSCAVLHNLCVENNVPEAEVPLVGQQQDLDYGLYAVDIQQDEYVGVLRVNPDLTAARQLQQNIVNNFFL